MPHEHRRHELDSTSAVSRRDFARTLGAAALAASVPLVGTRGIAALADNVGPTSSALAETAVARFFATLKPEQKKLICFPFDHPLRSQVRNNWAIVKPTIQRGFNYKKLRWSDAVEPDGAPSSGHTEAQPISSVA